MQRKYRSGFTLIELLVVIFIIGIILTIVMSNILGVRSKARDATKKENMRQFVNALRLYYNDYGMYPAVTGGGFMGCGALGDEECPAAPCTEIAFSAGGSDCDSATAYLKILPDGFDPADTTGGELKYVVNPTGRQEFRVYTDLETAGDPAIDASQVRCPEVYGASYTRTSYAVCER